MNPKTGAGAMVGACGISLSSSQLYANGCHPHTPTLPVFQEARAYENEFEAGGTWNELVEDETGNLRVVRSKRQLKSGRRKSMLS